MHTVRMRCSFFESLITASSIITTREMESLMRYREIGRGKDAVQVSAIGLGEMPLSIEGRPDEGQAIRTIHAALGAGMTLIDTADAYSLGGSDTGHGERLVAKALATYAGDASEVLVATK